MAGSEYAQIKQRIADEYLAAKWGLTGLACGTSQHTFITARMENMGQSLTTLIDLAGSPQEAAKILADTLEDLPETPTRDILLDLLRRHALDTTEETATLIERIQALWQTIDLLKARFGPERAQKIIETPPSCTTEKEEGTHE
ncbi:MAG: hypothetical protein JOZ18_01375 [Chloroflexi bacterium]|nr:hypothetical protein [Chloroflexota bacterium]